MRRCRWLLAWGLLWCAPPLAAQRWDSPEAVALVRRASARRLASLADTTLRDFSARAHGFVFFLGQIGEGLSEPPRLIKADQLELEVYWRAPNRSKQRIVGWRDGTYLPTDINYHRDHLGIVLNNFADAIRLGDGDEVRDVPHPLADDGPLVYEFALVDSLEIRLPDRAISVYELRVRPRTFTRPALVGSVYLDVAYGDLVRMTFNFTRSAYRDDQLEDISVAIENSLFDGRFWLPSRQEIEIRRRATWLDFPARGIIRGRWEIDRYRFNTGLGDSLFTRGPEIVAAAGARTAFPWTDSLDAAVRDIARPARLDDFAAIRAEATAIAMGHVLTGLRQTQLGGAAVSDFVRVNRVEGLALGLGLTRRSADQANELRLRAGAATAQELFTGAAEASRRRGATTVRVSLFRDVREMGDAPVISRAMNSLLAQEFGADYGDYYLAAGGSASLTRALGGRTSVRLGIGRERVDSLLTRYTWARGAFDRPNPAADAGTWSLLRLGLRRQSGSFATEREATGRAELEAGTGPRRYVRGFADLRWQVPAGATHVVVRASAGVATRELPRHRAFTLGGRGTLLGEPFRGRAGRAALWSAVEWQIPVGLPEVPLGSYGGTGRRATLAPWLATGWTGGVVAGYPAAPSRGAEGAAGIGLSLLHDLLRIDVGMGLRSGRLRGAVDVSRVFWDIL